LIHAKIAQAASWIFENLLQPCFNMVYKMLAASGRFVLDFVVIPIAKTLTPLLQKISSIAKMIFDHAIVPAAQAIRDGFQMLGERLYETSNAVLMAIREAWQRATSFLQHPQEL
jgi:cyclopropane fatty-acyl-phospholipid synthase-like methyltransferase